MMTRDRSVGQIGPPLIDRHRNLRQMLYQHRRSVGRDERQVTACHLIADYSKRVEIAASVDLQLAR